jgi:hypothetical protein
MKISNIKSSADFVKEIDKLTQVKGLSYFDAVMHYCESNNIEVETAASLIKQSTVLKARIQVEAENLNLVRRSGRLPI